MQLTEPTPKPRGVGTPLLRMAGFLLTPKCTHGAKVIVTNERGEVLLTRQRLRERRAWDFPGGFIGRKESPEGAAKRELEEETGVKVSDQNNLSLLAEYKQPWARHYEHLFTIRIHTSAASRAPTWEISATGWFSLDALPTLTSAANEALIRAKQKPTLSPRLGCSP